MRTPGDDFELAAGLLWSEGRISGPGVGIRRCPELRSPLGDPGDVVCVDDDAPVTPPESGGERPAMPRPRLGLTASSCGVCGVEQIEALVVGLETLEAPPLSRSSLFALIDTLGSGTAPASQELFARTGGAHAAMVTDARGSVLVQLEDIGRHNAVDKVVGPAVARRGPTCAAGRGAPGCVTAGRLGWMPSRRMGSRTRVGPCSCGCRAVSASRSSRRRGRRGSLAGFGGGAVLGG